MTKFFKFGLVGVTLAASLVGCGGGGSSGGSSTGGGDHTASSGGEVSYAGPIQSTDVALGERKYNSRCNGCHAGGPTLNGIGWTAERLRRQIREGSGGMNAIPASALSDSDMEAVLAYMVTIGGAVDEAPAAQLVAQ